MTEKLLPVSKARDASKRLGLTSMIVLQEFPDGRWGYTSYGKDRKNCDRARKIADQVLEHTYAVAWEGDYESELERGDGVDV